MSSNRCLDTTAWGRARHIHRKTSGTPPGFYSFFSLDTSSAQATCLLQGKTCLTGSKSPLPTCLPLLILQVHFTSMLSIWSDKPWGCLVNWWTTQSSTPFIIIKGSNIKPKQMCITAYSVLNSKTFTSRQHLICRLWSSRQNICKKIKKNPILYIHTNYPANAELFGKIGPACWFGLFTVPNINQQNIHYRQDPPWERLRCQQRLKTKENDMAWVWS